MLFMANDECDGLYFLLQGEIDIYILQINQTYKKDFLRVTEGTLIGEISYFLNVKRTATVVNYSNTRVCFLSKDDKKLLQSICPQIANRMQQGIYKYNDEAIVQKTELLRASVSYFRKIEKRALIELAFQLKVDYIKRDELIFQQFHKLTEIIIVYSGSLDLLLPKVGKNIRLDNLRDGSSIG